MKKQFSFIMLFFSIVVLTAQEKTKDTIFFKLDDRYVYQSKNNPQRYLLKDNNKDEIFFFEEVKVIDNLQANKILCLKKFIRESNFYNKNKNQKLDNQGLINFFSDYYVVYLVRKTRAKIEYIYVEPSVVIYD